MWLTFQSNRSSQHTVQHLKHSFQIAPQIHPVTLTFKNNFTMNNWYLIYGILKRPKPLSNEPVFWYVFIKVCLLVAFVLLLLSWRLQHLPPNLFHSLQSASEAVLGYLWGCDFREGKKNCVWGVRNCYKPFAQNDWSGTFALKEVEATTLADIYTLH